MDGMRTLRGAVAFSLLLVAAGCSDLPVQIGKDNPAKADRKGRVVPMERSSAGPMDPERSAGSNPLDPNYEQSFQVYRRSYMFWNAEQKQLEESLGGNNVAFSGAYQRIVSHLTKMSHYLGADDREKLEGHLRQYRSMYDLASSGNRGRLVERQLASLGQHVRSDFSPATATIVPLVAAGPELPEGVAVGPHVEPGAAGDGNAAPAGEPAPVDLAMANPKAPPGYVEAFADWRAHHKALLDTLFSEAPKLAEPFQAARGDLAQMQAALPESDKERLQLFLNEYDRTAQGFVNGDSARRAVNRFRTIAGEIEKDFAPAAVRFP